MNEDKKKIITAPERIYKYLRSINKYFPFDWCNICTCGSLFRLELFMKIVYTLQVQIFSQNDKIVCSANCWSWLKRAHLAEDCHSYNVELIMSPSTSHLRIRATRTILPEERLILWFSRDLIAILQIPYLTLNNIRGKSC